MKKKICPLEKDILSGLKEDDLKPEFKKHASECPVCKDYIAVFAWMNRFKKKAWETDMPEKSLPDAYAMWNKVFLRKRPDEKTVKRALRPLIYPQVISFVVFSSGVLFLGIKGILKFGTIFDSPALTRMLPYLLILISIVIISIVFCTLLIVLEKRKKSV